MSAAESVPAGERALFRYEMRKNGRPLAVLIGVAREAGAVTVQTEVFPVGEDSPVPRPFEFPSRDHALRFVDETLVALEYLGCELVGP